MKVLYRSLWLCLFTFTLCWGQSSPIFKITKLPKQGILLDKGWKWHAGDNPEWAQPEFDDSTWEAIDPTKDIMELPQVRKAGKGYFRMRLWVDSSISLTYDIVTKWHGGELSVQTEEGQYTEFVIRLPATTV